MPYGPHEIPLPVKGRIELESGVLVCYRNDDKNNPQPYGRIFIGPDGLTMDGMELTIAQKDDPAALRLASRGSGARIKGKISYNHLRDDGRGEELAYDCGGLADDAPLDGSDLRGQLTANIRVRHDSETETVWVATTAFLGRVWTGMRNSLGWLWKFSYPNDDRPRDAVSPPALLRAPGGETETHMQGDGNLVTYDVRIGLTLDGRPTGWVPLWATASGKLRDFRPDGHYFS